MSPRAADPAVASRLVDAAARVLSTEGPDAVTARRLAREVGASTMAVYTHFGSMDELLMALRREGFRRFGAVVGAPELTDDPVADWCAQGWAYLYFARTETHLWSTIFGPFGQDMDGVSDEDVAAAFDTFEALELRVRRCAEGGRWTVDDPVAGAEVCWAHVHGLASIEFSGYFAGTGRDPQHAAEESMRHTSVGFGDDPRATARSVRTALQRAQQAGHLLA
jgi:AcrR family transcriptional regulator